MSSVPDRRGLLLGAGRYAIDSDDAVGDGDVGDAVDEDLVRHAKIRMLI